MMQDEVMTMESMETTYSATTTSSPPKMTTLPKLSEYPYASPVVPVKNTNSPTFSVSESLSSHGGRSADEMKVEYNELSQKWGNTQNKNVEEELLNPKTTVDMTNFMKRRVSDDGSSGHSSRGSFPRGTNRTISFSDEDSLVSSGMTLDRVNWLQEEAFAKKVDIKDAQMEEQNQCNVPSKEGDAGKPLTLDQVNWFKKGSFDRISRTEEEIESESASESRKSTADLVNWLQEQAFPITKKDSIIPSNAEENEKVSKELTEEKVNHFQESYKRNDNPKKDPENTPSKTLTTERIKWLQEQAFAKKERIQRLKKKDEELQLTSSTNDLVTSQAQWLQGAFVKKEMPRDKEDAPMTTELTSDKVKWLQEEAFSNESEEVTEVVSSQELTTDKVKWLQEKAFPNNVTPSDGPEFTPSELNNGPKKDQGTEELIHQDVLNTKVASNEVTTRDQDALGQESLPAAHEKANELIQTSTEESDTDLENKPRNVSSDTDEVLSEERLLLNETGPVGEVTYADQSTPIEEQDHSLDDLLLNNTNESLSDNKEAPETENPEEAISSDVQESPFDLQASPTLEVLNQEQDLLDMTGTTLEVSSSDQGEVNDIDEILLGINTHGDIDQGSKSSEEIALEKEDFSNINSFQDVGGLKSAKSDLDVGLSQEVTSPIETSETLLDLTGTSSFQQKEEIHETTSETVDEHIPQPLLNESDSMDESEQDLDDDDDYIVNELPQGTSEKDLEALLAYSRGRLKDLQSRVDEPDSQQEDSMSDSEEDENHIRNIGGSFEEYDQFDQNSIRDVDKLIITTGSQSNKLILRTITEATSDSSESTNGSEESNESTLLSVSGYKHENPIAMKQDVENDDQHGSLQSEDFSPDSPLKETQPAVSTDKDQDDNKELWELLEYSKIRLETGKTPQPNGTTDHDSVEKISETTIEPIQRSRAVLMEDLNATEENMSYSDKRGTIDDIRDLEADSRDIGSADSARQRARKALAMTEDHLSLTELQILQAIILAERASLEGKSEFQTWDKVEELKAVELKYPPKPNMMVATVSRLKNQARRFFRGVNKVDRMNTLEAKEKAPEPVSE